MSKITLAMRGFRSEEEAEGFRSTLLNPDEFGVLTLFDEKFMRVAEPQPIAYAVISRKAAEAMMR